MGNIESTQYNSTLYLHSLGKEYTYNIIATVSQIVSAYKGTYIRAPILGRSRTVANMSERARINIV